MAEVTTFKHKFASFFSRQRPLPSSQSPSFLFLKLPYDVRVIVYSYVETELPLSPRIESFGFYQSCRQAKEELDEIVHKKLQGLCNTIEKAPDADLTIHFDSTTPRHITVTLPYSAFIIKTTAFQYPKWRREVLSALQPLFAPHLNVLRIHIFQQGCTSSTVPRYETLREKLELQDSIRHLLMQISSLISHQNHHWTSRHPLGYDPNPNEMLGNQPDQERPPSHPSFIRAQRICLSWDLRSTPSDSIALVGRMNEILELANRAHLKAWYDPNTRHKTIRSLFPTLRTSRRTLAMGYYLRDSEHLVGEMGISSPSRWYCNETSASGFPSLVGNESRLGRLISSRRLGGELEGGLGGTRRRKFENTEEMVDKVRAEVREERYEEEWQYAHT